MLPGILLVFVFQNTIATDLGNANCPCRIHVNENGTRVADCRNQNLTEVPDCVPNDTQRLEFGSNDLRYSPGQFQRFGNISHLYISKNKNFAAHIDSFQLLFSLEVLDLSNTISTHVNGETFRDQTSLKKLSIRGFYVVADLCPELFEYLGSLEHLVLGSESSIDVPNWSFIRLPLLSKLDLVYIVWLKLHTYSFYGLSDLKYLNLQDSVVSSFLPDKVFKPLIGLEDLHLQGLCSALDPAFDCLDIDKRLQYISSLKRLHIDKQMISYLGKGFLSLRNLEELYLVESIIDQTCEIADFERETFKNLIDSPLIKLVLSHCNIKISHEGWFEYLPELKEVSLSVETFFYQEFWLYFSMGLETTTVNTVRLSLTLNSMHIEPQPLELVDGFNESRLLSLELTGTRYYMITDATILKLPKTLKYLNLTQNYIYYFGVESLEYLENLETLDLSNQVDFQEQYPRINEYSNQFASKKTHFSSTIRNEEKNLRHLNQLRISHKTVTRTKCLRLPYRLEYLDLSKSRLLCNMVPVFFDSNNSLRILNASNQRDKSCFISRSFWYVLKNLANLEEINLNENLISFIPNGAFSGLKKLKILTLFDNKLLKLSFALKGLIALQMLDLSANSIQYASNDFTSEIEDIFLKTNMTINLSINLLACNCKQLGFVAWLLVTKSISRKHELNCTFENGTQVSLGQIGHVLHIFKYNCIMLDVTLGCSITFFGLNILLGGLAYFWMKRQKLRYLVSFGRRTLNPYHPTEDRHIEMEYDVYISYEGDFQVTKDKTLRDFVIYTILPGLEQRRIRVMIREELDAGRNLYEDISRTVRRSQKVVAFLTNGYCSDMWNVFEFNQAVMEGIYTNRQVAIPVLFESLRRDKVKEEICAFLQMEPVHKYSPELSDRAFIDFLYERIRDTRQFD